jgi:hypothetical protein
MTRASTSFPSGNEPGHDRSRWSGSDGSRDSVSEHLVVAKSALEEGDVKTAFSAIGWAMHLNEVAGRAIGMPSEAPEMKSLAEARFHAGRGLDEIRMLGRTSGRHIDNAMISLDLAMRAAGVGASDTKDAYYGGSPSLAEPVAQPVAKPVTTTNPNAGGDHTHDDAIASAIAAIDMAISQEQDEDEEPDDTAPLRVAKAALQEFLQVEHAEYDDDDS